MKSFPFKPLSLKLLLLLFTLQLMHRATAQAAPLELVPAIPYTEQQTKLPRVLLIGDSISFGYAEIVAKALQDKAQVFRIKGRTAATVTGTLILDTSSGLNNIDSWLKEPWDVIHFNWGLHDVKMVSQTKYTIPIVDYEANLEKLVTILGKSNAKLIWASTTPVPEGKLSPPRLHGDEIRYNEAASRVMTKHHIPTDDLYSVAQLAIQNNKPGEVQIPSNVHFTTKGSEILANSVEQAVLASLPQQ